MGIDKPDVRIVVHVTMASNLEGYYQEAGRAGRDGLAARCVLLHAWQDRATHEFLIDQAHPPRRAIEALFAAIARRGAVGATLTASPAALARATAGACTVRQADAALRVLVEGGLVRVIGPEHVTPSIHFVVPCARACESLRGAGREADADRLRDIAAAGRIPRRHLDRTALDALQALHDEGWIELRRSTGNLRLERLAGPPPARLPLDWLALARQRRREIARLARMQGYAFTRHCRRAYVLRYFGDPDAADRCSGCDNCLGLPHRLLPDAHPPRGPSPRQLARQLLGTLKDRLA
jgi:ATP-dependent DNA helicase RecQ